MKQVNTNLLKKVTGIFKSPGTIEGTEEEIAALDGVEKRVIWLYWENQSGKTVPPHIQLCRQIMKLRSKCNVRLVTPENLPDYLPEMHPNINLITRTKNPDEICLAIKTGFIRIFLLEKYGGLYIDSDAIVLRGLRDVFKKIDKHGFVSTRKTSKGSRQIPNNFLGSKKNGHIISIFANKLRKNLTEKTEYRWGEIGAKKLTPVVNKHKSHAHIYPEELIHPLSSGQQSEYLSLSKKLEEVIPKNALTFMLFHRIFDGDIPKHGRGLKDFNLDDLYYNDMLLSRVFRSVLSVREFNEFKASSAARGQ